jgi:hypothetical protein
LVTITILKLVNSQLNSRSTTRLSAETAFQELIGKPDKSAEIQLDPGRQDLAACLHSAEMRPLIPAQRQRVANDVTDIMHLPIAAMKRPGCWCGLDIAGVDMVLERRLQT